MQQKRLSDSVQSGDRIVQVPVRALIELSKTPRTYFRNALELMEEDPGEVREPIVMAADIFDLEAGRADGPMQGQMRDCAVSLRKLGEDVETRTVLSKDHLEQQFAKALHTLATFEQGEAERGLADKNVLRMATAIRQSNYDLALALVYSKQKPSAEASRAMYDADTLGEQLLNLETPTTGQLEARSNGGEPQKASDTVPPEATAKTGAEPLNGANQVQAAALIPKEPPRVIAAMKSVLE